VEQFKGEISPVMPAPPEQLQFAEYLPVGVCVLQRDGTVRFWNHTLENWTNISKAQITGQKINTFFTHIYSPRYRRHLKRVFEAGETITFPASKLYPALIPSLDQKGHTQIQHVTVTAIPAIAGSGFDALLSIQNLAEFSQPEYPQSAIRPQQLADQNPPIRDHPAMLPVVRLRTTSQRMKHLQSRKEQEHFEEQEYFKEQEHLIDQIAQHIRQSLKLNQILQTTVTEVQKFLKTDRVIIYRFNSTRQYGSILTEACSSDYPPMLGWVMQNVFLQSIDTAELAAQIQPVEAIADITQTHWDVGLIELLQVFAIKAQLIIPIFQEQRLWGLLITHQCSAPRQWQPWEVEMLQRLEIQLAVAIKQAELYQQVQDLNADLEKRVSEHTIGLQQSLDFEAILKRITDKVRDSLDEEQILQTAVEALGKQLKLQRCNTGIYDNTRTSSTVIHEYTNSLPSKVNEVYSFIDYPQIYQQLLQKQHFQMCSPPAKAIDSPQGWSAILACSIFDNQGILGDIWLYQHHSKAFDEREVRLVQQVANQCAIAIRQARLYHAAQQQVEELEKLNRLKIDFLSTISHELRTPLSSIKTSAQLLEMVIRQLEGESTETAILKKAKQYVTILKDECDREIELVTDILTLQQLEANTQPFIPSTIELQYWIAQVVGTFEEQAQTHQQSLHVQVAPDLPPVTTDLFMFDRVLGELLTNACKFTPPGQSITVRALVAPGQTEAGEQQFQIQVINTGTEIPQAEQEAIFQPFYRIPNNDPWKYGGTGMGLALVKRIVSNMGGLIWADCPGHTSFTVQLPIRSNDSRPR
jgi:signal transduction histidine kinase